MYNGITEMATSKPGSHNDPPFVTVFALLNTYAPFLVRCKILLLVITFCKCCENVSPEVKRSKADVSL